jgi:hypothetical protein
MHKLIVAGHLVAKPQAVALMGDVGPHLIGLRHVRVGSDTYQVTRVWPAYDSITGRPDWQRLTWFAELAGQNRMPEYGSRVEVGC